MAFLSPHCPRLKLPLLREPQDRWSLERHWQRLLPCNVSPRLLRKQPCLVFFLTPPFTDQIKLQLTPSPIHAHLLENKIYFHQ